VRNFFPRVSPFFILDRRKFQTVFEKARDSLKELSNFLTKEYVKTKTLEETFQLIDKLRSLEQQLAGLREQKMNAENMKAQVEKEIAETLRKMADLKSKGSLGQLGQTSTEIDALSSEVRHSLQHLQKPFVKLQSLATHGEGSGLTPEELNKLNLYVENSFKAFATEEPNHPLLRQILQKLNRSMSEGKLKLKPEKTRKAEQAIESILNKNSLADLHQKSVNVMMRRQQLSTSTEVAETEKELTKLREQLEAQEKRKKIVEGELITLEKAHNETIEKIRNNKAGIEKNVFDFMSKRIRIE
jgi:DNA repair exonuclease SbcCD ATPase subunit